MPLGCFKFSTSCWKHFHTFPKWRILCHNHFFNVKVRFFPPKGGVALTMSCQSDESAEEGPADWDLSLVEPLPRSRKPVEAHFESHKGNNLHFCFVDLYLMRSRPPSEAQKMWAPSGSVPRTMPAGTRRICLPAEAFWSTFVVTHFLFVSSLPPPSQPSSEWCERSPQNLWNVSCLLTVAALWLLNKSLNVLSGPNWHRGMESGPSPGGH